MDKEDVVCISTMEYYSIIKNHKIMKFVATRIDLEIILLSEVSQTGRDKYQMISLIFGKLFLKNDTNELISKTETVLQILKINLWLPKGKQGRER